MDKIPIAIVGDFKPANEAHVATNNALKHCAVALRIAVEPTWIATEVLLPPENLKKMADFAGVWIAPASPYKSMEGALTAIRWARESGVPLLGTCGGFQHIILEYARNVLGFPDAQHEETDPQAARLFISRLSCSLVGRTMAIRLVPGSLVGRTYGQTQVREQYYCNFGVNPHYVDILRSSALHVVASDDEGVVRAVELAEHPFFVGTLFLPQFNSTPAAPHPLVTGFIETVRRLNHQVARPTPARVC